MKNMSSSPSSKTVFSNWKVGAAIGIACLTGLVAIIGYGSGPSGTLSKFSQTRVTSKTAASLWTADTSSEHRKRLPQDYAPRVDSIVVAILRKGSNLQNVAFRSYLTNLSSGIRALGDKPAYAGNEEIASIINYLAVEIGATASTLDTTGDFLDDAENIVSGGAQICPVYDVPNPPPFCRYNFLKNPKTGCDEPSLTCEEEKGVCTQVYKPVCAQPQMSTCPEGMTCMQVFPPLQTYSNACMAGLEGATVQYEGECKTDPSLLCPQYNMPYISKIDAARGCKIVTEMNKNGCEVPRLVCPEAACTKEYSPVCGNKPFVCDAPEGVACPALASIQKTYNNKCLALADGATDLMPGVCKGECKPAPELTKDEAGRGCVYTVDPTFAKTDCPVYSLKCKIEPVVCPDVFQPVCAIREPDCITNGGITSCGTSGLPQVYGNKCEAGREGAIIVNTFVYSEKDQRCVSMIINDDGMRPYDGVDDGSLDSPSGALRSAR